MLNYWRKDGVLVVRGETEIFVDPQDIEKMKERIWIVSNGGSVISFDDEKITAFEYLYGKRMATKDVKCSFINGNSFDLRWDNIQEELIDT
jgi:hypothetical protein